MSERQKPTNNKYRDNYDATFGKARAAAEEKCGDTQEPCVCDDGQCGTLPWEDDGGAIDQARENTAALDKLLGSQC